MELEKEMTAPVVSVGADTEQSSQNLTDNSLTYFDPDFKVSDDDFYREMQRRMAPDYLETVSMTTLYDTDFEEQEPLIDGLLYRGAYLLAGSPKVGKSFLMAQLAYQVSSGLPLLGYKVRKGTAKFFTLLLLLYRTSVNYARLQRRLFRMFGAEAAENLYFATHCKTANSGLEDQIRSFMKEHPNTGLIIIDTLKRVREVGGADFSYSSDYDIVARLKTVADSYKVTMVIVHHTRKLAADDKFDMIAGTNGLLGAADGGFVLSKEKRTSNAAVLDVTGRDQEDQRLHLTKNPETLVWELESVETELWQEPPDPFLESIAAFLSSAGGRWDGTASELCGLLHLDCKPNVLSLRLSISSVRLLRDHDIHYKASRNHGGRKISLWKEMELDSVSKGDDRDGLLVGSGEA